MNPSSASPIIKTVFSLTIAIAALLPQPANGQYSAGRKPGQMLRISVTYIPWLEQDARWIATPGEVAAFKSLNNDEERDKFVDQFWLRRDPTPDTLVNEFEEEHYRRMVFSNQKFTPTTFSSPGWASDRGHIYIAYGPPDSVNVGSAQASDSVYPKETWQYRWIEHIGANIKFEFNDRCKCNEYRLEHDPTLDSKEQGQPSKLKNSATPSPQVKYKDLEEVAATDNINSHKPVLLRLDVNVEDQPVTGATTLITVNVRVKNKDITLSEESGMPPTRTGEVEVFGRLFSLTGRIAGSFEQAIYLKSVSRESAPDPEAPSTISSTSALRPGLYRLDIVAKDVNSGHLSTWRHGIRVPGIADQRTAPRSIARTKQPVSARLRVEAEPEPRVESHSQVVQEIK